MSSESIAAPAGVPGMPIVVRRAAVAAYFLGNGVVIGSWFARIPGVQLKLNLSTGELGLALLGLTAGALVGMPIAGRVSAWIGSRTVTAASLVLMCIALPLTAMAANGAELAAALFFVGYGHGSTDVSMNAQAVAVERAYGRPIMSSFHGLWSVGSMTGAAIGAQCIRMNVPMSAHLAGVCILFSAVALGAAMGLVPAQWESHAHKERGVATGPMLKTPIIAMAILGGVAFCSLLGEGAMSDWSAIYLHRSLHTTQQFAADGYAVFALAMACGRFAGDSMTHRFGPVAILRSGGILAAAGLAAALLADSVPATMVGLACAGAGLSIAVPVIFSAAGRLSGTRPGSAIAVVSTIGYVGFLVGPPLIGFTAEAVRLRGALWFVVINLAIVAALAGNVGSGASPGEIGRLGDPQDILKD